MKKITFLLVVMLAFCWQGHAQFTEDFEGGVPGAFTEVQDAEAISWGACSGTLGGQTCPINGSTSATFYRASYTPSTTSLTTPSMDLSAGGFRLEFVHSQLDWVGDQNTLLVEISTDDGGTWTTIENFTSSIATPTAESYLLDAYTTTATTQIRFTGTTNYGYAIVLDDVVVEPVPSCTPTVVNSSTVVDDCGNSQFSIDVDVASVGDGTNITDGLGGSFPIVAGTVTVGPYTIGDTISLNVEHSDPACDFSLGDFNTGCTIPGEVCSNPIIISSVPYNTTDDTANYGDDYENGDSSCNSYYMSGDDVVYSFTPASNGIFTISLSNIGSTYSGIHVLDGCPGTAPNCIGFEGNSGSADRVFDVNLNAGTTYYIVISTFATPQSTTYTLDITQLACSPGVATATVVEDCGASTYTIDVTVSSVGDATDITDGTTTLPFTGTQTFGPYAFGTTTTLDVVHSDSACNYTLGTYVLNACPPANDTCATPETVSVGEGICGPSVTGNNTGATDSGEAAPSCGDYAGGDLWYQFTVPTGYTQVNLEISASAFSTTKTAVYDMSMACGSLNEVYCDNSYAGTPEEITGLTAGETYLLRLYDWGNNDFGDVTFCISTPPSCMQPTNLVATTITETTADLGWTENGTATTWDIEWGESGFTPTGTPTINDTPNNPHTIGGLTHTTLYDFYVRADCGGGDTSTWVGPYTFSTLAPPPANDDCAGAFSLIHETNIPDAASATANPGTIAGATDSGIPAPSCDGFTGTANDDVWFSFEALTTDVNITLIDAFDGVVELFDACGGTSIACKDTGVDPEIVTTGLTVGNVYYVRVFNYSATPTSTPTFDLKIWTSSTASINDFNINSFTYYPNPVNNTLTLKGQKALQEVTVFNIVGQEVLRTTPNTVKVELDMSSLQAGTYFVRVMAENATKTIKVTKK